MSVELCSAVSPRTLTFLPHADNHFCSSVFPAFFFSQCKVLIPHSSQPFQTRYVFCSCFLCEVLTTRFSSREVGEPFLTLESPNPETRDTDHL